MLLLISTLHFGVIKEKPIADKNKTVGSYDVT